MTPKVKKACLPPYKYSGRLRFKCPKGIDATSSRLSWELSSSARDLPQTAYQVPVTSASKKRKEL